MLSRCSAEWLHHTRQHKGRVRMRGHVIPCSFRMDQLRAPTVAVPHAGEGESGPRDGWSVRLAEESCAPCKTVLLMGRRPDTKKQNTTIQTVDNKKAQGMSNSNTLPQSPLVGPPACR